MDVIQIEVKGVDYASRWFRSRSGKLIQIVTPAFVRAGELARRGLLRGYDTPGDAEVYRRTGTYGRKTQVRKWARSGFIQVNVYNLTPYAKWVGVSDTQAWFHRGTWPTDVEVLKEITPEVVEEVSGALIRGLH